MLRFEFPSPPVTSKNVEPPLSVRCKLYERIGAPPLSLMLSITTLIESDVVSSAFKLGARDGVAGTSATTVDIILLLVCPISFMTITLNLYV